MKVKEFNFQNVNYKYKVSGTGPEKLVVFHGFDQNIYSFDFLSEHLNDDEFTLYSIGLLHHDSIVNKNRYISERFSKIQLIEFFDKFCSFRWCKHLP